MSVLKKLKQLIESHEWFDESDTYSNMLQNVIIEMPGFPKVEIDGDTSEGIKFVVSENYNEEQYELLDLKNFQIISAEDEQVIISACGDEQVPLTFSIKLDVDGDAYIIDVYTGFNDGLSFDEFDDLIKNS